MKKIIAFITAVIMLFLTYQEKEPVKTSEDVARELLAEMTLEEKVGQMFLVACPDNAVDEIKQYSFGGLVFFADTFRNATPDEIRSMLREYDSGAKIPMLFAVDEEGGTVSRVGRFKQFRSTPFLSPRDTFEKYGWQGIEKNAEEMAELLTDLGLNLNLAPVCDLSDAPEDFIYKRAFSGDAEDTSDFVEISVKAMKKGGLMTCLKHFPGYASNVDTHTSLAYDERSIEELRQKDYLPFMAGIEAGAPFVMVSHNVISSLDTKPASLSEAVHAELRELGFEGAIMTDDLAMSGVTQYTDGKSAAILAVQAGNDILCTSTYKEEYSALLDAVKNGEISEERIDASVLRILKIKIENGVIK